MFGINFLQSKRRLPGVLSAPQAKKLNAPYKSEPSKVWLKIKNPKTPAATRVNEETF
jgi:hypothetical protein